MSLIPRTRGGTVWRFLLAAVVIVAASAATTAVAGLLTFKQLAQEIVTPSLKNTDTQLPDPGQPQTLLVIGSDHRIGESFSAANTDTMMLIRLNPNSSTVNVLSIPRDLKVDVPGYGTSKINAAYSDGGPNLMIRTIKQNVFPNLKVNHILDVNFGGFADLVDAIGCVYSAVDRRYYNDTALTNYSSINIQPGYQRLCGDNQAPQGALAFVRFRHTDSDLVRNARQQDFLRWAKEQYSSSQLLANKDKLLKIFGRHVQTDHDLHTVDGLINLFNLVVTADGLTIKSVHFPAQLENCGGPAAPGQAVAPCYVTATSGAEARTFGQFMRPSAPSEAKAKTHPKVKVGPPSKRGSGVPPGLAADVADGRQQAGHLRQAGMPVYFPRFILSGSSYCSSLTGNCNDGQEPASEYDRSYPISYPLHDQGGHVHAAYYMTIEVNQAAGEYYGVQGTTWKHPPLLAKPSATKFVNGRKLLLFAAGGKLTTVAWRNKGAVYWIENTLTSSIPNQQMVAIAASLMP